MERWDIVLVVISLIGLISAVVAPLLKVSKAMTRLTVTLEHVGAQLDTLADDNTKSHRRMWEHNNKQDTELANHETRIACIEHAGDSGNSRRKD